MGSLAAPFALYAAELATPRPPGLERLGQSGTNTACYWVAAANESNQLTDLSDPVSITNLPDALNERNKVLVRIQPVEGAQTYYVLKTEILQAPGSVRISARTSPALVAGDIRLDLFIPAIRSKAQRDEPSPQKSIHRRLSDTLKRQIDTWKGDAGSHVADDLKPVMVSNLLFEINALLLSRDFHETEAWREIHLDDEDRKAIENRTTLDAEALARLNRDLLDAAFPDSITKWKSKNPLGTYYYWIAARNTWRWSALAGPFVAKDVDITKGVRLEWQPVPSFRNYSPSQRISVDQDISHLLTSGVVTAATVSY